MNIELANRALIKIGQSPISSANQEPLGKIISIVYDEVKLLLLSSYCWRFAIKRATLPRLNKESENPRFKNVFQLPKDCLLFRGVGDFHKPADLRDYKGSTGTRWEIEGDKIYSNLDSLPVVYIANVDEELFSAQFKEAFSNKLASELSIKVHQNLNLVNLYEQKYQASIQHAITCNEIIADTEELRENSWLAVREGWRID
jgi:hypothetical protein